MRKLICILICLTGVLLSGCGSEDTASVSGGTENSVLDLTLGSATFAYAQAENIFKDPTAYTGKNLRVSGVYNVEYMEESGNYYHYVAVGDVEACCAKYFEFIWNGAHTYPDDYPVLGEKIEIYGVFTSYEEDGKTYFCIKTDEIISKMA